MSTHAVLLVGSPRGPRSTSHALGSYLLERLGGKGITTHTVHLQRALASRKGIDSLLQSVEKAEIIILATPLYADSHHSGVTAAMELIRERVKDAPLSGTHRLVAISNSGFPEPRHNDLSLAISRRFALESGFHWAGGLALGGGESIGGRPLEHAGGLARNVRRSLEIAGDALARGEDIPDEAVNLMARPLVPKWLYLLIGNMGWHWSSRKQGCRERLDARPYLD